MAWHGMVNCAWQCKFIVLKHNFIACSIDQRSKVNNQTGSKIPNIFSLWWREEHMYWRQQGSRQGIYHKTTNCHTWFWNKDLEDERNRQWAGRLLIGLLLIKVGVVLILEHRLYVPPHQRQEEGDPWKVMMSKETKERVYRDRQVQGRAGRAGRACRRASQRWWGGGRRDKLTRWVSLKKQHSCENLPMNVAVK